MCEECRTVDENKVRRPVRLADFLVVGSGFFYNIVQVFEALFGELHDIAIYHASRKNEESKVWESFAQDLEKIPEDTDGA